MTLEELRDEILEENREYNFRYSRGSRKKLSAHIRHLKNYTSSELHAELGRRRRQVLADKAPEVLVERLEKSKAVRKIRREFCDHSKLAPKLRGSGPNKGRMCCPSCFRPVDGGVE